MSRQITILVMIDTDGAFRDNSLEGNIYLVDSERLDGSTGEGTGDLTTVVGNGVLADGSQSEDIVLNWCVGSIDTLPPTLPRFYAEYKRKKVLSETVTTLLRNNRVSEEHLNSLRSMTETAADPYPYLADINGEAVDEGVIFPAQYGTPVPVHGGWYWSASVSTYRPGSYSYVMHLELYRQKDGKQETLRLEHRASIRIANDLQRNGFTGAGLGILPVCAALYGQKKGEKHYE